MSNAVLPGLGCIAKVAAAAGALLAIPIVGVAAPAQAAPGVGAMPGTPALVDYPTGGDAPPCAPDSTDPSCAPPVPPPWNPNPWVRGGDTGTGGVPPGIPGVSPGLPD